VNYKEIKTIFEIAMLPQAKTQIQFSEIADYRCVWLGITLWQIKKQAI
jgi:hypothetical protein